MIQAHGSAPKVFHGNLKKKAPGKFHKRHRASRYRLRYTAASTRGDLPRADLFLMRMLDMERRQTLHAARRRPH